jgi:hypothetical protein
MKERSGYQDSSAKVLREEGFRGKLHLGNFLAKDWKSSAKDAGSKNEGCCELTIWTS